MSESANKNRTVAGNFRDLAREVRSDPDRARRVDELKRQAMRQLVLHRLRDVREARGVTQVQLAEALGVRQPTVAGYESQDDWMISTLKNTVEALGGRLRVEAVFDVEDAEEIYALDI